MLIAFDKAYDLKNTLLSGQVFRWLPYSRDADGVWWITGVIFNNIVSMRRVDEGVEFVCEPCDEEAMKPLISEYLRLSEDLDRIKASINKDDHINEAIESSPGLHILRQDPWECMVSFICSPQQSIPRIRESVDKIARAFGSPLELGRLRRNTFPSPADLAKAGEERLRALEIGRSPNRVAKYLAAAAERVASGEVDLYALREMPYDEAFNKLNSFAGIGPKVGDCTLLYALDKPSAFPVDVHVMRALQNLYPEEVADQEREMSLNEMRQWAQAYFGEYAGYAQHWLFYNQPKGN